MDLLEVKSISVVWRLHYLGAGLAVQAVAIQQAIACTGARVALVEILGLMV